MNLSSAFAYPFKDSKWWLKALIASICNITCIGVVANLGYSLRVVRNAAHGQPLPMWKNWKKLFFDGLRVLALVMGYLFPGILFMALSSAAAAFVGPIANIGYVIAHILMIIGGIRCNIAYMFLVPENSSLRDCFDSGSIDSIISRYKGPVFLFLLFLVLIHVFFNMICSCSVTILFIQVFDDLSTVKLVTNALLSPLLLFINAALYAQLMQRIMPDSLDEQPDSAEA